MTRNYKLAANFNTVEFTIDDENILQALDFENEAHYDEDGEAVLDVAEDVLIKRILQKEYDILASIDVINVAPPIKQAEKIDPPSEKQAKFAEALGMKDAMKHDKKEVWAYIQKHKND
jgi:hypothetical protein